METKSISRLLSLLELGGQTALVRIYPAGVFPANEGSSGAGRSSQGGSLSHMQESAWYAELYLQAGQLEYAAVFTASGERRMVGNQALTFLGTMGGLSYDLLPLPPRLALPPSGATAPLFPNAPPEYADYAPAPTSPIAPWRPVRTSWGEHMVMNPQQLTRDQRRVLSLINGQRSVDELSRLLGFSPDMLSELLYYLRDQRLIS